MNIAKTVILCAGHGGYYGQQYDSGATGQGTTEAAEVIDITNRTVDLLRKDGQLKVIHVPNELNFEQGIDWVNANYKGMNDGLSIEVHKNSTANAKGVETWFYGGDSDSQMLAGKIQAKLAELPMPNRGIKPDTSNRFGQLGWMREVNTWSILVEMGFVSNGGDPVGPEANQRYAEALAKGILNVWGLELKGVNDMYKGKTAAEWAKSADDATRVAETRAKYLASLALAAGVNPNKAIELAEVEKAVKLIDDRNKAILTLKKQVEGVGDSKAVEALKAIKEALKEV